MPRDWKDGTRSRVYREARAEEARSAGADVVGFDDLAESIKGGSMDFDVVIASPDAMRIVGAVGSDPGAERAYAKSKVGTVTVDVAGAVKMQKRAGAIPNR